MWHSEYFNGFQNLPSQSNGCSASDTLALSPMEATQASNPSCSSVLEIQKIIKSLVASKIGILITDHNVRETLGVCNKAYIINNGEVVADGPPSSIIKNKLAKKVYLGENFKI